MEARIETISFVARFPQVRVFHREFDTLGANGDMPEETGISTNWILRLDADYQVTEALKTELSHLDRECYRRRYRICV